MKPIKSFFVFILLFQSSLLLATTYTAISSGDWTNSANWSPIGIPGSGDDVVINGYTISHLSGTININQISISNSSNTNSSYLIIGGTGKIIVANNVIVNSENHNFDTRIKVENYGELEVLGDVTFTRTGDNLYSARCQLLLLNNGKVTISRDFYFYHNNGNETYSEVWVQDDAVFTVGRNFIFERTGSGSGSLAFDLNNNAQVIINGYLEANLTGGPLVDFLMTGNTSFSVKGNMSLNNSGGTDKSI